MEKKKISVFGLLSKAIKYYAYIVVIFDILNYAAEKFGELEAKNKPVEDGGSK